MSRTAHLASRFSRVFTAEYARRLNAQITSQAAIIKPTELVSAMARPLHLAVFEPDKGPEYLPAALAFGLVKERLFVDGNKRTAYFIANEYRKALGLSETDESVEEEVQRYMDAAARYGIVKDLVHPGHESFVAEERPKDFMDHWAGRAIRIGLRALFRS